MENLSVREIQGDCEKRNKKKTFIEYHNSDYILIRFARLSAEATQTKTKAATYFYNISISWFIPIRSAQISLHCSDSLNFSTKNEGMFITAMTNIPSFLCLLLDILH